MTTVNKSPQVETIDFPTEYKDLLDKRGFAHVATIGSNGEPQSNPVWYDFDGQHLMFSQVKTRQKVRNIQRDPRVAVSITDPEDPYRYLEVRGVVTEIADDGDHTFVNGLAKKYLGEDEYPYHQPGDERVIVKVAPVHTTSMG